jgi:hypothetical protein
MWNFEKCIFWLKCVEIRDHSEGLVVDGRIKLKRILRKEDCIYGLNSSGLG